MSDSLSRIFKYSFSYTALALRIAGLIERKGLPSIEMRTNDGNRLKRGSNEFMSLFEIY